MVTYFRVSFCLSYIEIIVWASTLIKNVYFVDERVFQQKERSNVSHFSEIPKFYFIVTTLRSRIDAYLKEKNLSKRGFVKVELGGSARLLK